MLKIPAFGNIEPLVAIPFETQKSLNSKMINIIKESVWKQFGASIDMLKNSIQQWPEEQLRTNRRLFYIVYHTIVFLDYYLTFPPKDFLSPLPFTIKSAEELPEEAVDDIVPDRFYSKAELIEYLQASREKSFQLIMSLTEEKMNSRFIEEPEQGGRDYYLLEILLYNMRHVQHHAAQLNLLLKQGNIEVPNWVSHAQEDI